MNLRALVARFSESTHLQAATLLTSFKQASLQFGLLCSLLAKQHRQDCSLGEALETPCHMMRTHSNLGNRLHEEGRGRTNCARRRASG